MYDISHRKEKQNIKVISNDGKALANQRVSVKLKNHEFLFGIGAFDTVGYFRAKDEEEKSFYIDREQKALDVFNYMTVTVYWGLFEATEGQPLIDEYLKVAKYLKEKNITLKGHPLCWHTVCADWLLKYDDETIYKKQLERIERDVTAFKGLIDAWDVINETVIMPVFDKYDNAVTRICNAYGRIPLIKAVFDEAYNNNKNATLLLNDFNTTADYERVIEQCLDAGVKINTLGIQSHQHQGYWGQDKIYDVLERFSKYKLPIHFTENTILSGDLVPEYIEDLNDWQVEQWPSTEAGEELQAQQMEEMYRILFADPHVEAISWWDFVDGSWLNAPSGLIKKDNTCKKAYYKLKDMIKNEWNTSYEAVTDDNGNFTLEGFKGDYEIVVNGQTSVYKLSSDSKNTEGVITI